MNNAEFTGIVVKIIFSVLSIAITYYLIPFLKSLSENYQDEKFKSFVKDSVKAVEQTIKGSGKGSNKKEEVLAAAKIWLAEHHMEMSDEDLSYLIESLVFDLNAFKKEFSK